MKMIIVKPKYVYKETLLTWAPEMNKWIGKQVTIKSKDSRDVYRVKENPWSWHISWLKDPLEYFLEELDNEKDNS